MPAEEYTIRITKRGEVVIECDGVPVRRLKDLAEYLRETVGPLRAEAPSGDGSGGRVELDLGAAAQASDERAATDAVAERERLRRRDE